MKKLLAAAIIGVMLPATSALADHRHERASDQSVAHKDAKDVENKLDIRRVDFRGHGDGNATLTIETRKKWGCNYISGSSLDDGNAASIRWAVNKNRDPYFEREAFFFCGEDGWSLSWGSKDAFEARRPNRRTLKVRLPLDELHLDRKKHLKFTAVTFANGMFGDDLYVEETDASTPLAPLATAAKD